MTCPAVFCLLSSICFNISGKNFDIRQKLYNLFSIFFDIFCLQTFFKMFSLECSKKRSVKFNFLHATFQSFTPVSPLSKKPKHAKFSEKRTFLRFSEILAYFVFFQHLFRDSPFCLINEELIFEL